MSTATGVRRTFPVEVDVPDGTTVNPGQMASGDLSDYTPNMLQRFEAAKRAIIECCGKQGQLVTFTRRMQELFAA